MFSPNHASQMFMALANPPSFHAVPTVWDHQNLQIAILANFAVFGPFLGPPGPNLGAPSFSKLVHNLRLGPPQARSTFVPRCSNRLGPPEPSDRQVGPSWANLGRFWGPLGQIWGHPASPNWFKIFDLDLSQPVPALFHSVPTVWDHRSLQIAILANLGSFWAVFGP